jgi:hypothetical protein
MAIWKQRRFVLLLCATRRLSREDAAFRIAESALECRFRQGPHGKANPSKTVLQ